MITGLVGAFGGRRGGMLGGRTGGMIGSMAGSMLAGRLRGGARAGGAGGIGGLLSGLTGGGDQQASRLAAESMPEDEAMILVKAMCNAAKADGHVSQGEVDAIIGNAGDLDPEDEAILRGELAAPLDLATFVAEVPSGLEADVYAASLLPIEVDTPGEVEYLRNLAQGLSLSQDAVDSIHEELGLA